MGNININGSGTYSTLNSAVAAASGGDTINITGTWSGHDTTNVTWDVAVSVRADSDSKQDGKAWQTGDTTYRLRPTSGHVFTVSADVDIEDINIISDSTGTSDEIFRVSNWSGTRNVDITNCILGFSGETDQQDIIYSESDNSTWNITLTSCQFFDVGRSIIDAYAMNGCTCTVNFNGCSGYNIGGQGARFDGCWVGVDTGGTASTWTVNAFHNLLYCSDVNAFAWQNDLDNVTINADYNITNVTSGNLSAFVDTENTTGNGFSYTFTDDADPGAGDKVGFLDITTSPYDLRLTDHANNDAVDFHSIETGPNSGLALPNDIVGTVRGASEDHDVGSFEISAAVGDLSVNTSQSINLSESIVGQLSIASVSVFENINLSESVTIADLLVDLAISVLQQINLTESISSRMNLGGISKSETINIAESISGFLSIAGISISENITLNENIARSMDLGKISTSETINISEFIAQLLSVAGISVSDNVTLNENISRTMNLGAINVNETVVLAESLASGVPLEFSKFENITISEFLSLLETIAPSAFENITINELITLLKDIGLSAFENITINEQVAAAVTASGLNVFDSISINEAISILKDIGIDTSQQINISEVVSAILSLAGVDRAENITINEALGLLLSMAGIDTAQNVSITEFVSGLLSVAGVDVSDNLTLTEFVNLLTTSDLPITDVSENITISEAIELLFAHLPLTAEQNITVIESVTAALTTTGIDVSNSLNISEYAILILSLGLIDVSDNVTISEAITALLETTGANVYDTITVNEFILNILEVAGVDVSESVTVSEWVYVTMVTVAGLMRVNFSVRKPYLNYATRKPKITFN